MTAQDANSKLTCLDAAVENGHKYVLLLLLRLRSRHKEIISETYTLNPTFSFSTHVMHHT